MKKAVTKKSNDIKIIIILTFLIFVSVYISLSSFINLPISLYLNANYNPISYALIELALVLPFIYFNFDILKDGFDSIIHKKINMEVLVLINITLSLGYSIYGLILVLFGKYDYVSNLYFSVIAILLYFIKIYKYLDIKLKNKANELTTNLIKLIPNEVIIKTLEGEKTISIKEIKKGNILVCKSGNRIVCDGIITYGKSYFNESFATGETTAKKKRINDHVIAGSICLDGYIEYKVDSDYTDSKVFNIISETIKENKKVYTKIIDNVASYIIPIHILVAILLYISSIFILGSFNKSFINLINILMVGCPYVLYLSVSFALHNARIIFNSKGILLKNSNSIQKVGMCKNIIFDKTGTLTYGHLQVSKLYNYSKYTDEELLDMISSIESKSSHPIASAFKMYNNTKMVTSYNEISGIGVWGIIDSKLIYIGNNKLITKFNIKNNHQEDENALFKKDVNVLYVIVDDEILAIVGVSDVIRKDAKTVIDNLKKLNKNIIILSGDNITISKKVGNNLDVNNIIAGALPNDKEKILDNMLKNNNHVIMIGDGINDAPSLIKADIGISFSTGTDIAEKAADVILTNDNLNGVYDFIMISNLVYKILRENIIISILYNLFLLIPASGLFNKFGLVFKPSLIYIIIFLSSITVIFNSLRVLIKKR